MSSFDKELLEVVTSPTTSPTTTATRRHQRRLDEGFSCDTKTDDSSEIVLDSHEATQLQLNRPDLITLWLV